MLRFFGFINKITIRQSKLAPFMSLHMLTCSINFAFSEFIEHLAYLGSSVSYSTSPVLFFAGERQPEAGELWQREKVDQENLYRSSIKIRVIFLVHELGVRGWGQHAAQMETSLVWCSLLGQIHRFQGIHILTITNNCFPDVQQSQDGPVPILQLHLEFRWRRYVDQKWFVWKLDK